MRPRAASSAASLTRSASAARACSIRSLASARAVGDSPPPSCFVVSLLHAKLSRRHRYIDQQRRVSCSGGGPHTHTLTCELLGGDTCSRLDDVLRNMGFNAITNKYLCYLVGFLVLATLVMVFVLSLTAG